MFFFSSIYECANRTLCFVTRVLILESVTCKVLRVKIPVKYVQKMQSAVHYYFEYE